MDIRLLNDDYKSEYNHLITHVIQSWEWGEFRQKLGLPLLRYGIFNKGKMIRAFQLDLHKIPFTNKYVGYLPKGPFPDKQFAEALSQIGKEQNCAFIKIEPLIETSDNSHSVDKRFKLSPRSLFTKFNYLIDLTKPEEEILKNMHQKTRYNIKVAQKHGVWVEERTDKEGFEIYLKLYFGTTERQRYLGHNQHYHQLVWETLQKYGMARVLIGYYTPPDSKEKIPLNAWMIYNFGNTLYYPYGGSSNEYRNVMAPTLVAWEAIKLGKRLGMKTFDLWGALEPNAPENHPWQGFTKFKANLGSKLIEYIGTFDLVFDYPLYFAFNNIDKFTSLKVLLLKLIGK